MHTHDMLTLELAAISLCYHTPDVQAWASKGALESHIS